MYGLHLECISSTDQARYQYWAKFSEHTDPKPLAALNDKSRFDAEDRYNVSKLLNLYSVRELANYTGSDINVNVVK